MRFHLNSLMAGILVTKAVNYMIVFVEKSRTKWIDWIWTLNPVKQLASVWSAFFSPVGCLHFQIGSSCVSCSSSSSVWSGGFKALEFSVWPNTSGNPETAGRSVWGIVWMKINGQPDGTMGRNQLKIGGPRNNQTGNDEDINDDEFG